ncbi:MAG: hypothetical protein GDA52_01410 [Rhodobacteraceae bacterium]|nr:hypothetical protein [Paracoccaceae bacterium]
MTTAFEQERRAFDRLRLDCAQSAQQEYELAIQTLLEGYNTTIHENRFIAGGAVKVFTYALLRSVGIECTLYGDQAKAGDLLLPNGGKLSVKGSFVGVKDVRLLNQMGTGERKWDTATLLVVAGVGIVFGAPDMVGPSHLKTTGDALVLRSQGLQGLIDNPANLIEMDIAHKPPTEMIGFNHKASTAVARQILFEMHASALLKAFPFTP